MGEPGDSHFETEWSFSFDAIGNSIKDAVGGMFDGAVEAREDSFSEPKGEATSAIVNLHGALGQTTVEALGDSENLFEADLRYIGEVEFTALGDTTRSITLRQKGHLFKGPCNFQSSDLFWKVRISPAIPLRLNVHGIVGESEFDLTNLQLQAVKLNGIVSRCHLILPQTGENYPVHIRGNVGPMTVSLARDTDVNLHIHGNVGKMKIVIPENTSAALNVHGSVGKVEVIVPEKTGVRIMTNGHLGTVKTATHIHRVRKTKSFLATCGIWETDGFNDAGRRVIIRMQGGLGLLSVMAEAPARIVRV